jgi:RNA polymerase sigma factor (sigma-70 family)
MQKSIEKMITNNTGLLFYQLHAYRLHNTPEAESLGYEALYRAAQTFDVSKGYAFSTYATVCIKNALGNYMQKNKRYTDIMVLCCDDTFAETVGAIDKSITSIEDVEYLKSCFLKTYKALSTRTHKRIVYLWLKSSFEISTIDVAKEVGVSQSYASQVLTNFRFSLKKEIGVN